MKIIDLVPSNFVSKTGNETIAGVKTFQNEIINKSSITAGQDSGSVSLTVNDGQGNANVAFNHKNGIPDTNGSSARIVAWVDDPNAEMEFQLKSNTVAGEAEKLTTVMTMRENAVIMHMPLVVPNPTAGTHAANKAYVDGKYSGFKNYIINGGFDIWQRGNSFSGANEYTADRWLISGMGGPSPITLSKSSVTASSHWKDGIYEYANLVTPSNWGSVTQVNFEQRVEDLKRFSNKTLTVSFYVKGTGGLSNEDFHFFASENYGGIGSGGSATVYHGKSNFASSINGNKWVRVSHTFTVSDLSTKTFGSNPSYLSCIFVIKNTAPANSTIQITNVQLEEGSVATPFEQLSYALQYEQCRRYARGYHTQQNRENLKYEMRGDITVTNGNISESTSIPNIPYFYENEL